MGTKKTPKYQFKIRQRNFQVIADKILFFRVLQRLHGRFWGIAAVQGMILGLGICFLIRPDLFLVSTAFSDFGKDVRTAPYFAGTMFYAAYGLWRWRNYLIHTLKRSGLILILITCTIIGLYLVALMPVSWHPWPYRLHFFGVALAGVSMAATVIADSLLTKVSSSTHMLRDKLLRITSFLLIVAGGYLTYGSSDTVHWFRVAFIGESLLLLGYSIWVFIKTIQGEGQRSRLSKLVQKIITIT